MTSFEFVFGLISVVTSLALTQLLSGIVRLYRRGDRLRLSWRHGLWTATALMVLIGNWGALWDLRSQAAWGVLDVVVLLAYISVLYAFCDLVMPDDPVDDTVLDLREFHAREGKRYKTVQLVFAVLVLAVIARDAHSFQEWLHFSKFAFAAVAIGAIAVWARSVWLDTASAAALTVVAAMFMVSTLQALTGPTGG